MKKALMILITLLLLTTNAFAVVVSGSGETKEEAITNGLRAAVEMCTGSFIYGVTDIENYTMKKDQIVASSMGHIKNYRLLKVANIDNLVVVTLDVSLSEDKIEAIIRNNVNLVTAEDVMKDYHNVAQRQKQMRKFMDMIKILGTRPISEKYNVIYEGYEIKRIGLSTVDTYLRIKIAVNPYYSKAWNEILKNLSFPENSSGSWGAGGNYRIVNGKLINNDYYITNELNAQYISDIYAMVYVNGKPTDACRKFRDNLYVVYSPMAFLKGALLFPALFKKNLETGEENAIDPKYKNTGIAESTILPPEGLPFRIKYRMTNAEDIKNMANLKLTLDVCKYE